MKIEADQKRHMIIIDGKHYRVEEENGKPKIIEIQTKDYDKKINEIAKKLIDAVDKN